MKEEEFSGCRRQKAGDVGRGKLVDTLEIPVACGLA